MPGRKPLRRHFRCARVISLLEALKSASLPSMNTAASSQRNGTTPADSTGAVAIGDASTGDRLISPGPPTPFRETRYGWLTLAIVWAASVAYMAAHLHKGLIPSDAGMLAEMAARVLRGQLPYRGFIEVYTGGLTYLNAFALRLFGMNFFSMRIPLFLFFLGWVPSVYFLARRFAGPFLAGAVTVLAVVWSVPNYPEAMPSWYNLFFTTWGVLALIRYTEGNKKRWLWIAGVCAGLSFLVKIAGLYFVAAALLFFVFRERTLTRFAGQKTGRKGLPYRIFVTGGLVAFLVLLADVVAVRPKTGEFFQFVLPSACIVAFLLWEEWRQPSTASGERFRRLFAMGLPFLVGAALPVAAFLAWYVRQGALRPWLEGMLVLSSRHLIWAGYDAISFVGLSVLIPVLLVVIAAFDPRPSMHRLARYGSPALLFVLLLASWRWFGLYVLLGCSPPLLVVLAALVAPFCLRPGPDLRPLKRQEVFLIVVTAVVFALIQYPYSMLLYFYYVAPLLVLALLALWSVKRAGEKVALSSVFGFYLAFALVLGTPGFFVAVGVPPYQPPDLRTFALKRAGGILVPAKRAAEYEDLVRLIRRHAHGKYIYATPDCPQVYFLSGFRNPTRTIYEFLAPDFLNPIGREDRVMRDLQAHGVNLVVLAPPNPQNSGPVPAGLRAALDSRYPDSAMAGKFEVRWRR